MPTWVEPLVSVIIPTHNRSRLLRRNLDALAHQTYNLERFQVVVVADGCVDDTLGMLSSYAPSYQMSVLVQPGVGPAEARNVGAAAAEGTILLFLDDDVEPQKDCVNAHVKAHAEFPESVVLGPYPPLSHASASLFRLVTRHWWTQHFHLLNEPGHRFTYRDLLTGNLSLSALLWRQVGGLDPSFRRAREDYELGIRLIQAGVRFVYVPQATCYHHEHDTMTLNGAFRRKFEEGRSDAQMGLKHPQIRTDLHLAKKLRNLSTSRRLLHLAIFSFGEHIDFIANAAAYNLPMMEKFGLRSAYLRLLGSLKTYWYIRGAADRLGSLSAWRNFAEEPVNQKEEHQQGSEIEIDLHGGFDQAESYIDQVRPSKVILSYGSFPIGTMPYSPGAEPWRGTHLRPFILRELGPKFLQALAANGEIGGVVTEERYKVVEAIARSTRFFGTSTEPEIWSEQYAQWRRFDEHRGSDLF